MRGRVLERYYLFVKKVFCIFFGVLPLNVGLVMKKINIATLINCKYWKLEQFSVAFFVRKLFHEKFRKTFATIDDNKLMMKTGTVPG